MSEELVPVEIIENKIFLIRGQKVMIDRDLAQLYGVETSSLNRQVRRNIDRFPSDFMFQLTVEEYDKLVPIWHQFKTRKHSYVLPFAFTQEGIAMLSSVLRSPRAIQMNIAIMRVFIRFRQMIANNQELAKKLELLEKRVFKHDSDIRQLVRDIRRLSIEKPVKTGKIGFLK